MRAGESENTLRLYFFGGATARSQIAPVAAVLLALLLIFSEQADCIYPLHNRDDTASDDRPLGTWQPVAKEADSPDKNQRWNFVNLVHSKDDKFCHVTLGAVITATTEGQRKFMQAHAEDPDALSENYELKEVK